MGYSIFTEADTWEELKEAVQDAVRCHCEEAERPSVLHLREVREDVGIVAGGEVRLKDEGRLAGIEILDALKRFGGPQVLRQVILEDVGLIRV